MTKTIVLGINQFNENSFIEFKKVLTADLEVEAIDDDDDCSHNSKPCEFNFIECICKRYNGEYDLMFAYNDESKRQEGNLFIGKWNNGLVK